MNVLRKIVEYILIHFIGQSNMVVDTKLKHQRIFFFIQEFLNGFVFLECTTGRDHNHMAHEYVALQIMTVGSWAWKLLFL